MTVGAVVFFCFFSALIAALVAYGVGVSVGREGERENLVQARGYVHSEIDEDGCRVGVWTDNRTHGLAAFEIPYRSTRAATLIEARAVLEKQGEEGAVVAEAVLLKYRARETPRV